MKNRKLQRVLTWILTLTMILGTFGETGFAVRAAEPDEEAEVVVEDEDVPDSGEAVTKTDDADSEEEDPEIGDPDSYTDDIQFVFVNPGATATVAGTKTHVRILDGESRDKDVAFYGLYGAENAKAVKTWDSSQDYEFIVEAATGYVFDSTKYVNQKDKVVKIWATKDGSVNDPTDQDFAAPVKVTGMDVANDADAYAKRDAQYSVDFLDASHAKVTIFKDWMVQFRKDYVARHNDAAPAIMIQACDTLDTMPSTATIGGVAKTTAVKTADTVEGAQPDTYVVALNENYNAPAVTEAMRTATYGYDMSPIVMTAGQGAISGRPVTGVKIRYYSTILVTLESDTNNAAMGWVPGTLTLTVPATLVNLGYLSKNASLDKTHWMEIEFLSTPIVFTQTNENAADNRQLNFKLDGGANAAVATGLITATTAGEVAKLARGLLVIYEADAESGRILKDIDYTVASGGAKGTYTAIPTANVVAGDGYAASELYKSVYIPKANITGSIAITGNFAETLTWVPDDQKFIVRINGVDYKEANKGADGLVTYYPYTDKDFTFGVYTPDGKTKLSVKYKQGTETFDAVRNADDEDFNRNGTEGLFTIPKEKMNQKTELIISSSQESDTYGYNVKATVYTGANGGTYTVKSSIGATIDDVKIYETKHGQQITGVSAVRGTKEQPLYFTVLPVSDTDNVVKAVYWKEVSDGDDNSKLKEAVLQSTGKGLYMIPAQSADIEIQVVIKKLWLVKAPTNDKVVLTINGKTYSKGDTSARVEDGVGFEYSLKTTDEAAIKITKTGYAVATGTANAAVTATTWNGKNFIDVTGETAGNSEATYQVSVTNVTNPIAIYAQTLETRVDGDGYYVDFASASIDTNAPYVTSSPAKNAAWEAELNAAGTYWATATAAQDDAQVKRIKEDDMYVLRVNQNTSATLTPVIRKADGKTVLFAAGTPVASTTTIDVDKTEFKIGGLSSSLITIDKDATNKYKAVITAKAQGDDTMAYTVTQKTLMTGVATDKYDENLVAVNGKVKVRVTPHFELTMTTPQSWVDTTAIQATLTTRNGATLDKSTVKATTLAWGKAGTELGWSTSAGVVTVTPDTTNTTATIVATGEQEAPYMLYAFITDTDATEYTSNKVALQPVDKKNYILVPEVQVTAGGHYFGVNAADRNTTANGTKISLGVNDLSMATLTVHPLEGAVNGGIAYADVNTEQGMEAALNLPVSDNTKYAAEIESGVTYTAVAKLHGTTTSTDALTITDNQDGTFGLKAVKNSSADIDVIVTATYGWRTFTSVVTFDLCDDTEWIKVDVNALNDPDQVGIDGKEKVQKLSAEFLADKILWNSSTDDQNKYPPQGGNGNAYTNSAAIDGYQFKIINGAEFTLPVESDFDQSVFTDKSRMLVGWKVKAVGGAIIDESAAYEHVNGYAFYQPGETIAIAGGAEVQPIWGYRYAILAAGVAASEQTGFFIDNGKTQKINVYSFNTKTREVESLKEERTNDTLQLGLHADNVAGNVTMSPEASTISLTNGMTIGATVLEYINAQNNNGTVFNRIYPAAGNGNDSVQWYFFNETISGTNNKVVLTGGNNTTSFNVPTSDEIKNGGNASDNARDLIVKQILAEANQTVLDKEQLAKGILQGATAGKAYLYATYTDAEGNVYYLSDKPILVEVQEEDAGVTVNIEKIAQQNEFKNGIEVGQEAPVAATSIIVRVGTTTLDATSDAASTGTFTWEVEPSDALDIMRTNENTVAGELKPIIRGLKVPEASADGERKAGEAKVRLTYTAANGKSATSDWITIKVLPASYTLAFTDKNGIALDDEDSFIDAAVSGAELNTGNANAGSFYMTVKDAAGAAVTNGAFTFASDDETVVKGGSFAATGASVWKGTVSSVANAINLGEAVITATYTSTDGKTYRISIPFRSYLQVKFGGAGTAFRAIDSNLPATLDLANASKLNITNAAGTVISDATTHVFVKKIYKSDLNYKDGKGYTLDLADYKAVYTGDDGKGVVFVGWITTNGAVKTDQVIDTLRVNPAADQQMYAIFGDTPAESLAVNRTKIVLDNSGTKGDANEYVPNMAKLIISVGPKTSGDVIKIKSDNAGFLDIKEGEVIMAGNSIATVYNDRGVFADNIAYAVGDVVKYNNAYYVFKQAHAAGAWIDGDVEALAGFNAKTFNVKDDFFEVITGASLNLFADSSAKKVMAENDTLQDYNLTLMTKLNNAGVPSSKLMSAVTNNDYTAGKAILTIYTAGSNLTKEVTVIVTGLYFKDSKLHYMQASGEDLTKGSVTIGNKTYYFDEEGGQVVDGVAYNEEGKMVIIKGGEPQQGYINNGDKKGHNFYTDENGIVQTGKITTEDGKVYYGDPENGWLLTDVFVTIEGKLNYFGESGEMVVGDGVTFTTITSLKESVNKGVFDYLIAPDGTITTNKLITVTEDGKQVYVNSYGQKVTVAMATNGKYKDPVTEVVYIIDENGYATPDKIFYFKGYEIAEAWKWNDGAPSVKVTMKYAAADGDTSPTETLTLLGTTTDGDDVKYKTYTATTTAKYFTKDGDTEKEVVTLTKKFDKDGKSGEYKVKSVKFNWAKAIKEGAELPEVSVDVVYTVTEDDNTSYEEKQTLTPMVVKNNDKSNDKANWFTATVTLADGTVRTDEQRYSIDGNISGGGREVSISEDISIVGLEEVYYYTGKAIKPSFVVVDESRDVVLAKGVDYTVKYSANKNLGKGIVTIKGKGNYTGTNAKATFEIKDRAAIAKEAGEELVAGVKKIAKINETFVYNGLAQYPATLSVTLTDGTSVTLNHDGDGEYSGDKNVAVAVCNNVDKGTATVAAAGADGKYKTANFKIKVAEFGTAKIADGLEATYSVKGATPNDLVVTWTNGDDEEVELVAGQDYKATFKDNKKAGSGSIKLTGKGNFKGTLNGTFTINKFAPAEIDAVAAYTGVKAGAVKVTVLDGMGFALNQKKQLNVKVLDEDGKEIAAKTKLNAGQKISVVVTAKDTANVDIDESGLIAEVTVGDNLAKAKIDAKKLTKIYSGSAITLDDLDMGSVSVTYGKNKIELKNGEDFTIVGYTNNVKKGTMTVTIQGTGEETERGTFSGVKTFKVKVVPKTVE